MGPLLKMIFYKQRNITPSSFLARPPSTGPEFHLGMVDSNRLAEKLFRSRFLEKATHYGSKCRLFCHLNGDPCFIMGC
ncbi:MAG: hypothetical protein UZ16_OP3001003481 [Candidatus Hinthialibacteria bacterium OLB16]|nr:MAG: hypothetical protein UZ16_OP3001003481 [Candidatus Hinthialibacteria bacterium OLB16]